MTSWRSICICCTWARASSLLTCTACRLPTGPVLPLEVSQGSLFEAEILRLRLSRGKRPVERVQGGLATRQRALDPGQRSNRIAGVILLKLCAEPLDRVREAFLLVDDVAKVIEQSRVR